MTPLIAPLTAAEELALLRVELRRCQAAWIQAELRAHVAENALTVAAAEHALCCRHEQPAHG